MDFTIVPNILKHASIEAEQPRTLGTMVELLQIAYELLEHPILKTWRDYESIDTFIDAMDSSESYKEFNRTIIERTITQSRYFNQINLENGVITMTSKGIEFNILNVETFLLIANRMFASSDEELNRFGSEIIIFRLQKAGHLVAAIKYFMHICNELIMLIQQNFIKSQLNKIVREEDKVKYLLRQKANLQQQKDQFDKKVFDGVMITIQTELDYHKGLQEFFDIPAEVKGMVEKFLAERRALISNQKLLICLLEDKLDDFCIGLSDLVLQLFSYHDVGGKDAEKVYHAFLLGVFNSFKEYYQLISNKESGKGRFDIVLLPNTLECKGMIFEVKRSPTDNEISIECILREALQQIREHKYYIELKALGHTKFIGFAAAFYGKELFLKHELYDIL